MRVLLQEGVALSRFAIHSHARCRTSLHRRAVKSFGAGLRPIIAPKPVLGARAAFGRLAPLLGGACVGMNKAGGVAWGRWPSPLLGGVECAWRGVWGVRNRVGGETWAVGLATCGAERFQLMRVRASRRRGSRGS